MSDPGLAIAVIGLFLAVGMKAILVFRYLDSRFDEVERRFLQREALHQFSWRTYEEVEAWKQFQALNPDSNFSIPDIQEIKKKYHEK